MEEQLNLLIQLQEIDAKIRTQITQKNRLPETLAILERRRVSLSDNLGKVQEALAEAQKNKRDRDKDLETGVQKVEKLKTRSSEIKNNKEYQAHLKEIEAAEQENKAIEDDILGLMEKIDAAAGQITAAEQQAKDEAAGIQVEQKQQEAAFAKLEEELKAIEEERQKAIARIQKQVLTQYQKLLGTKAGIAVAEARGESCSGCYMSIPPQVYVNVKKNESIITCPNCGRILYFKETIVQQNT
ncbi:MAG: C4-type zinc ribbon domain-containing protein [Nitrospirae bacterium]|nr:C4-type zinc ribbon domain-containing protein [Nitrospirota bacterium]